MAKRFLTPIGIVNLASDPVSGSEGEIYYNSTDDILKIYVSGSWTPIEGGGGAAINVSASAPVAPEEGDAWFDNTDGTFYVYDGSFWVEAAQPLNAKLTYWTEDQGGNLLPNIDNIYSIGASAYRVKDLYLGASSLYIQSYSDPTQNIQISIGSGNKLKLNNDEILTYSTASSLYITQSNASSTYATKTELNNIDLTYTINTASAAAFASASAYTDSAIASFEALPSQSGNAGKYLSTSGSVTSWQALDLNAAINTASAAAVNYLVDSAPGTLDTLNELSAALNDDPNFYSTIQAVYLTQSNASAIYATKAEAQNTIDRWTKIYSASATTISGVDDGANSLSYTPNFENLYINGILVDPTNYTATSGSTIVLNEAVLVNDVVEVISISPFNVANTYTTSQIDDKLSNLNRWVKTLSSSATVISGVDDNSLPLSYTPGNEQVFINGILLKEITDYIATSASVITLTEAAFENDTVEVINLTTINVASVYTQEVSDSRYILNSASANFEPNIAYVSSSPSSPSAGTLWIDSTNSSAPALKVYNGSTWIAVSGTAETISPLLLMGG